MKNYLISLFYCLLYLIVAILGFSVIALMLDAQTYQTVMRTALFIIFGMSLFLSVWFRQDDLFFVLFLSFLTYFLIAYWIRPTNSLNSYYSMIAFPLISILYPINIYVLLRIPQADSFTSSLTKGSLTILVQAVCIYFFTYFIPALFGKTTQFVFETNLASILNFPFNSSSTLFSLPLLAIFVFIFSFVLLIVRPHLNNRIEQIYTTSLLLFLATFISFYFTKFPFIFNLIFIAALTNVLCSLLQISHKMAYLDELTNIPSRRALMSELKQIENQDYTLAMIDIDFFKRLNDSYGHEVGDQALRMITASLTQHGCGGTLYRYGGEEFVLLFPHKSLDMILDDLENCRELVSNSDFFLRSKKQEKQNTSDTPYLASIKITLSIGVAQKMDLQTPDDVINIADQALYKAKQTGRNKTVYNKNGRFFELF